MSLETFRIANIWGYGIDIPVYSMPSAPDEYANTAEIRYTTHIPAYDISYQAIISKSEIENANDRGRESDITLASCKRWHTRRPSSNTVKGRIMYNHLIKRH